MLGIVLLLIALLYATSILFLVLTLIGSWKSFEKAGQKGWKALIPWYSTYKWLEIANTPRWYWFFINLPGPIALVLSVPFFGSGGDTAVWIIASIISFVFDLVLSINIAKSFGLEPVFGLGLALLPFIFLMILGFGSATYVGPRFPNDGSAST